MPQAAHCMNPFISLLANQMRLLLHTAADWLVHSVRAAIPASHLLARAEFATIRLRLLKLAARVSETATRVRAAPQKGVATTPTKREAPRVPFGSLVERGVIAPGTVLTDRTRRVRAVVAADGSIRAGAIQGSIHKVGAEVQNAPACNGWTFWHLERNGELLPIDALRRLAPDG